jgi:hypothetical protein
MDPDANELAATRASLEEVRHDLQTASGNLALAENPAQFRRVANFVEGLEKKETALETQLAALEASKASKGDIETEVQAALGLATRLEKLLESGDLTAVREAIELTNAKLFVRFKAVKEKKRILNKVSGGFVTLGAAHAPVALYQGPTSRKEIKNTNPRATNAVKGRIGRGRPSRSKTSGSGREGESLGNVNRDDRIKSCLKIAFTAADLSAQKQSA